MCPRHLFSAQQEKRSRKKINPKQHASTVSAARCPSKRGPDLHLPPTSLRPFTKKKSRLSRFKLFNQIFFTSSLPSFFQRNCSRFSRACWGHRHGHFYRPSGGGDLRRIFFSIQWNILWHMPQIFLNTWILKCISCRTLNFSAEL